MPTDFDDGPPTHPDPEVADLAAEARAIDGPPDNFDEVTPTRALVDLCRICSAAQAVQLAAFVPPPADCSQAWHITRCCATVNGSWRWCPLKGLLVVDGMTRNCDRRQTPVDQRPGFTPDRRRPR
ncbi:MAG: hypothetical protein ABUS79_03645 [Pseudomonadota bacterium]